MDDVIHAASPLLSERSALVVEIVQMVPSAAAPSVAKRVAERLAMPEWRVLKLIDARTGPVSKPLQPKNARAVLRILEEAGVRVVARPPRAVDAGEVTGAHARAERVFEGDRPQSAIAGDDRSSVAGAPSDDAGAHSDGAPSDGAASDGRFPDSFVSAVLAGMMAVAMVDGAVSTAELRALRLGLEDMTGTDVGAGRIAALARSRGAGDVAQAASLLAELEPSLGEDAKGTVLDMLFLTAAAGAWRLAATTTVMQLADALRISREVVLELMEREQAAAR